MSERTTEFIRNSGACIISRHVKDRVAPVKWVFREESNNSADNGWRILSAIDDEEYINNPDNLLVVTFNEAIELEPALLLVYYLPVGSDMELVIEPTGAKHFVDTKTGVRMEF